MFEYKEQDVALVHASAKQPVFVQSTSGEGVPTGLGYLRQDDMYGFPLYHPIHIPSGMGFPIEKRLPTEHMAQRFLESLMQHADPNFPEENVIQWFQNMSVLTKKHGTAFLKTATEEAEAEARDLIGWENAENTLRHLFSQHSRMLRELDSEYRGRLLEVLDLVASMRQREKR